MIRLFSSSRIAWANFEYRYLLSRRSRVFVFYDQGYFFRNDSDERIESDKRSFGFGARLGRVVILTYKRWLRKGFLISQVSSFEITHGNEWAAPFFGK